MTFRLSGLLGILLGAGLTVCVASGTAQATASSCQGLGDGTACATSCIISGFCKTNVCVPTQLRPNGSSCISENRCTRDDVCTDGLCTNGSAVECPSKGCLIGTCLPQFGCLLLNACKPDLGVPVDMSFVADMSSVGDMSSASDMSLVGDMPGPVDLSGPVDMSAQVDQGPQDLGFYVDLAGTDLAPPVGDMCYVPPGAEFQLCNGADGPVVLPIDGGVDAAVQLDGGTLGGHLRGSRPGDCTLTPGARPRGTAAFFACLALLLVSLRRRAA